MDIPYFCFPHPETADANGLVAITEELTPALLLSAYSQGLFPWTYDPVGWFSPDPRAVFVQEKVHLPTNLGKLYRKAAFHVTCDTAFTAVMQHCRDHHAAQGQWISEEFITAYSQLHHHGYAHSVEVWQNEALVGGIYGVQIAGLFAGESMFYLAPNASKVAFAVLWAQLAAKGITLFDAQVINDNTRRLGAVQVPRSAYLNALRQAMGNPQPKGRWQSEPISMGCLK